MFRKFALVANIQVFLAGVKLGDDQTRLRQILEKCSKSDILRWHDAKGFDLLHHVIILKNAEAVQLLFSLGYFTPPYEPVSTPYAHLAAFVGHASILGLILQYRPFDNRKMPLTADDNNNRFFNGIGNESLLPVDVAGKAGHVECVKLILDVCVLKENPSKKSNGYLTLACLADCPSGLRLLCDDGDCANDLQAAIEQCIHEPRPECLDILLGKFNKLPVLFNGINPFHILYNKGWKYKPCVESKGGYDKLLKLTDVLIKYKQHVDAKLPLRTYPLYTLIRNSLAIVDVSETKFYIQCLEMLLKAGADPNFDEVQFEQLYRKKAAVVEGRQSYSSALHCLMDTVELYSSMLESNALAVKFIIECTKVLLAHQADANVVGVLGSKKVPVMAHGTVLHQFAKSSVEFGVDPKILRLLLRHEIDVDKKVNNKYAVNTFVDTLVDKIIHNKTYTIQQDYLKDAETFMLILKFMSRSAITETLRLLKIDHLQNANVEVRRHLNFVMEKIEYSLKKVTPLKRLCINRIWALIGRKASNVTQLPMKIELKTCILPNT